MCGQRKPNSASAFARSNQASARRWNLLLLNTSCPVLANNVDTDQLASEEANWSVSALFVIKYVNLYKENSDQVIWLAEN